MTSIKAPQIGFTKNGNEYQKTTKGKEIGTKIGAAYAGIGIGSAAYLVGKAGGFKAVGKFIKHGPTFGDLVRAIPRGDRAVKGILALAKHKSLRVATVATAAAIAVAVPVAIYAGLGRLIGAGVDGLINKGAKKEADRRAALEA